ncbi:hypothetical protein [Romboutsia sp.]|uniref:hypothetical protein n=1 Tax=Romboutsia sp. TaxID=1965302 RepID=UPI003F33A658
MSKDNAINREEELLSEFLNLAIKRFKWSNLPLGLTTDRLEEMLISHGLLGGFINETGLLTILPMHGVSKVNVYNEFNEYRLYGFNGYDKQVSSDEVCRLKNNPTSSTDIETLSIFAKRISDIESTQEVNLFQMNIPKIIATSRDGILTAKNIIKKIQDFKFVVFTREKGISSQMKQDDILDNTVPYLLDKLSDYENFYRNKVMTYLAINNANTDKKERLITDEVNANNDLLNTILDMMFECRQEFCDEIKLKFNIDIQVEKRSVLDGTLHTNITSDTD